MLRHDNPLLLRVQMKASTTERGPAARRGTRFSDTVLPELLEALKKARDTLRRMDAAVMARHVGSDEYSMLRANDPTQFELLRKKTVALQTDLRAELRRRGAA